ncbi:MAG: hypothetical protein OJJ54_16670 [Pseudonocardia sp.]|nr:hypothetical protein [Pseudonocardia sp.]
MLPSRKPPHSNPLGSARARKLVLTSVAALAVVLLPTACDAASASTTLDERSQQSSGHDHRGGATRTTTPAAEDGAEQTGGTGQTGGTDAADPTGGTDPSAAPAADGSAAPSAKPEKPAKPAKPEKPAKPADPAAPAAPSGSTNGLDVLARDCTNSKLDPATGFETGNVCVSTAFGEVGAAAKNPSLLITSAPTEVAAGQAFDLKVSTRNLVRDRFLGAAAGGYYLESSLLNADGLQRGHFHTACRMLSSTDEAPDASPKPDFFVATQDGGGGDTPDEVTIKVTGMPSAGVAQCSSWAGDGSHRIPMMQRANQTPAFDVVRIKIT